jgi:hypothetical protein
VDGGVGPSTIGEKTDLLYSRLLETLGYGTLPSANSSRYGTRIRRSQIRPIYNCSLKGLSHEIDSKNVDENGQILALLRAAASF